MAKNQNVEHVILDMIDSAFRTVKTVPLNLGGLGGAGGGIGQPPGGYIGQLPQVRVAYDETEAETLFTPLSGMSLVDNLNHIRYRINTIEDIPRLTVTDWDSNPTITNVTEITFSGAVVTQVGVGHALVVMSGGSGGPSFTGDANSVVLTDGAGALDTMPWLKWGIATEEYIEFGADEVGKEANAGRMGYETFGANYFWIVGAGINAGDRWVRVLDNLHVDSNLSVGSITLPTLTNAVLGTDVNGNVINANLSETVQDIVGAMVDSNVETGIIVTYDDTNGKLDFSVTPATPAGIGAIPEDGWIVGTSQPTYTSADSPIFVMGLADAVAAKVSVGNKIKLIQSATTKYFICHAKGTPSGGNTPITIYGGTDYTLANAAITGFCWSPSKSPLSFPMDDDKWTVTATNTANAHKTPPTQNVWVGGTGLTNTGISIDVPIGAWRGFSKAVLESEDTTVTDYNCYMTFSNANNTESMTDTTGFIALTVPSGTYKLWNVLIMPLKVTVASKTTHYLNIKTSTTTADAIHMRGDVVPTIIKLVSNYL